VLNVRVTVGATRRVARTNSPHSTLQPLPMYFLAALFHRKNLRIPLIPLTDLPIHPSKQKNHIFPARLNSFKIREQNQEVAGNTSKTDFVLRFVHRSLFWPELSVGEGGSPFWRGHAVGEGGWFA
jgi:hypothetical protein